jgi:predicted ATP-grasp superfamily ATP-dependent carboligase
LQKAPDGKDIVALKDPGAAVLDQGSVVGIAASILLVVVGRDLERLGIAAAGLYGEAESRVGAKEVAIAATRAIAEERKEALPLLMVERSRIEYFQ